MIELIRTDRAREEERKKAATSVRMPLAESQELSTKENYEFLSANY